MKLIIFQQEHDQKPLQVILISLCYKTINNIEQQQLANAEAETFLVLINTPGLDIPGTDIPGKDEAYHSGSENDQLLGKGRLGFLHGTMEIVLEQKPHRLKQQNREHGMLKHNLRSRLAKAR